MLRMGTGLMMQSKSDLLILGNSHPKSLGQDMASQIKEGLYAPAQKRLGRGDVSLIRSLRTTDRHRPRRRILGLLAQFLRQVIKALHFEEGRSVSSKWLPIMLNLKP